MARPPPPSSAACFLRFPVCWASTLVCLHLCSIHLRWASVSHECVLLFLVSVFHGLVSAGGSVHTPIAVKQIGVLRRPCCKIVVRSQQLAHCDPAQFSAWKSIVWAKAEGCRYSRYISRVLRTSRWNSDTLLQVLFLVRLKAACLGDCC